MQPGFRTKFKLMVALGGILAVAVTVQARGRSAYLAVSGPAPLRYAVVETNANQFPSMPSVLIADPASAHMAPPVTQPATKPETNAPPSSTGSNPSVEISTSAPADTNAPAMTMLPEPPATPSNDYTNVELVPGYKQTASDLLVMTPQMLNEYFKPAAGKNGTDKERVSVVVPMTVDFTPPTPRTAPASSATYKTP